jgi:hypothetical protein
MNLSAGIAFTAPIISISIRLNYESSAADGEEMLPIAGTCGALAAICAIAPIVPMPNTQQAVILKTFIVEPPQDIFPEIATSLAERWLKR